MTRHLIQGHFGASDRENLVAAGVDEKSTRFDLVAYEKVLDFGIGGALTELKAKNVFPSETALDLVVIAAQVYAADTRISRATESDDAWTREIRVVVPVSNVARAFAGQIARQQWGFESMSRSRIVLPLVTLVTVFAVSAHAQTDVAPANKPPPGAGHPPPAARAESPACPAAPGRHDRANHLSRECMS